METIKKSGQKGLKHLLSLAIALMISSFAFSLPQPLSIDGVIYDLDGITEAQSGIDFSVTNLNTGITINGKTGYGSPGKYAASLGGSIGDTLLVKANTKYHSANITLPLTGVIHDANFVLNLSIPKVPPNILTLGLPRANFSSDYSATILASDDNSDMLSYTIIYGPDYLSIDPSTGALFWPKEQIIEGIHPIGISVSDASFYANASFTIEAKKFSQSALPPLLHALNEENEPPQVVSYPNLTGYVGTPFEYQLIADDPNQDPLQFSIIEGPQGSYINETTGEFFFLPNETTPSLRVTLSVSDGEYSDSQTFDLEIIEAPPENVPPVVLTDQIERPNEDEFYSYQLLVVDDHPERLIFSLTEAPVGMSIDDESGTLSWLPGNDDVGEYEIGLRIVDEGYIVNESFVLEVNGANDLPYILSTPPSNGYTQQDYYYKVLVEDIDSFSFEYSLIEGPQDMEINQDGEILWPIDDSDIGNVSVTIGASDFENITLQHFTIEVTKNNSAPRFSSTPLTSAVEEQPYEYRAEVQDIDSEIIFRGISSIDSFSIDSMLGIVSFIPSNEEVGIQNITLIASDEEFETRQSYLLSVSNVNDAPTINSTPSLFAQTNVLYSYQIVSLDQDSDPLQYIVRSGPSNAVLHTSTGLLRWVPSQSHLGNITFNISISDGTQTIFHNFTIQVSQGPPLPGPTPINPPPPRSGGGGGGGGGAAPTQSQTSNQNKESEKTVSQKDLSKEQERLASIDALDAENIVKYLSVREVAVYPNQASLLVDVLPTRPNGTQPISNRVYRYLRIEKPISQQPAPHLVNFKVLKEWIGQSSIDPAQVSLMRYHLGKWDYLATVNISSDENYVYYASFTPGFSYFAISVKEGIKTTYGFLPSSSSFSMPYSIAGIAYSFGKIREIKEGSIITIENLDTSQKIEVPTGIGPHSGAYAATISGKSGQQVRVTFEGATEQIILGEQNLLLIDFIGGIFGKSYRPISEVVFRSWWDIIASMILLTYVLGVVGVLGYSRLKKRMKKNNQAAQFSEIKWDELKKE